MKCPICNSPDTVSAHPREFNASIRGAIYVIHGAYGAPLCVCKACQTAFVHFVHPKVPPTYRARGGKGWKNAQLTIPGSDPARHAPFLPAERQRVMYLSCGGIENADAAKALAPEVIVADPIFVGHGEGPLRKVNAHSLGTPEFVGAFDAVLVDQSICFVGMPQFWMSVMSRMLRPGGVVSLSVPAVELSAVAEGNYDIRSILFPQVDGWRKLVEQIPTLRLDDIGHADDGFLSMRLTNLQTLARQPAMSADPNDLLEAISVDSMTCMMMRLKLASIGRLGNKFGAATTTYADLIDHL